MKIAWIYRLVAVLFASLLLAGVGFKQISDPLLVQVAAVYTIVLAIYSLGATIEEAK